MLYNLTVKQINKATTKEKLADVKNKCNIFYLVGEFTDEQYKGLIAIIEEKELALAPKATTTTTV